jgi:hypothetical protein
MRNALWSRRDVLAFADAAGLSALGGIAGAGQARPGNPAGRSKYERTVLASRPAGYWRLEELRGPTAADVSGNRRNGRYEGRPRLGEPGPIRGDQDRAIGLDGPASRSYVAIPDHKAFSVATSGRGLTVEVWVRPDVLDFRGERPDADHAYVHWLGKADRGQVEWGFRFYSRRSARPNRMSAYIWNPDGDLGAGAYVEEPLEPRRWVYLVATYDDPRQRNARVRLYRNGAASPNNNSRGTLYESYGIRPRHGRAPVRLGTRDLGSFLTGGLSEVAIYPRVLPADEILRHWQAAQGEEL